MCLMEKVHVLDNLPPSTSYSAVAYEFSAHESKKSVLKDVFKQKHI